MDKCEICKREFERKKSWQKFCSRECKRSAWVNEHPYIKKPKIVFVPKICRIKHCVNEVVAKGICVQRRTITGTD